MQFPGGQHPRLCSPQSSPTGPKGQSRGKQQGRPRGPQGRCASVRGSCGQGCSCGAGGREAGGAERAGGGDGGGGAGGGEPAEGRRGPGPGGVVV